MEAIERIEVALRCEVYTSLVMRYNDPFCHCDPQNFPNAKPATPGKLGQHEKMLRVMREEAERSKEPFVQHFRKKYDEFPDLPLWAMAQVISFGTVLTLLNISPSDVRPAIAAKFNQQDTVFASWLLTLNMVRNICAHHSRLWNRELAIKPHIPNPKHGPEWHGPIPIRNNRVFAVLTMLHAMQKEIAPRSRWRDRVFGVFDAFPTIPLAPMGMQANWREHPLWS